MTVIYIISQQPAHEGLGTITAKFIPSSFIFLEYAAYFLAIKFMIAFKTIEI